MARTRGRRRRDKESVSGYFRKIFMERPDLLDSKSNEELVKRWKADHGANDVPISVRSNLANLKSLLRKRRRLGFSIGGVAPSQTRVASAGNHGLEMLEEHIDNCLTMARTLDRTQLAEVIKLLRAARNKVVWKLGE